MEEIELKPWVEKANKRRKQQKVFVYTPKASQSIHDKNSS
jgi:hypothetical protein